MRTTAGLERVDVIYRRLDDDFLDPVVFRGDSMLGVPGLVNAVRTGGVGLANAVGNGVADDKLIYTYVPDLIRYYLHAEPIIANVDTWRLEEDAAREEVLDRLAELVVKPVDGSGGKGIVIGPRATAAEWRSPPTQSRRTLGVGRGSKTLVQCPPCPPVIDDRHGDGPREYEHQAGAAACIFGICGQQRPEIWRLHGGLTGWPPAGELVVNSSQGGGTQ